MSIQPGAPDAATAAIAVAVGGAPGAGKTTLGRALAIELSAALLDQDTLTNPLIARIAVLTGAGDDLDHPSLRGPVRDARYACLRDTAVDVIGAGCSVVLVAPFTAERSDAVAWQRFSDPLWVAGRRPLLVEVTVDPELATARRIGRGLPRDRRVGTPTGPTDPSPVADLQADGAAGPTVEAARLAVLIRRLAGGT